MRDTEDQFKQEHTDMKKFILENAYVITKDGHVSQEQKENFYLSYSNNVSQNFPEQSEQAKEITPEVIKNYILERLKKGPDNKLNNID